MVRSVHFVQLYRPVCSVLSVYLSPASVLYNQCTMITVGMTGKCMNDFDLHSFNPFNVERNSTPPSAVVGAHEDPCHLLKPV